MASLDYYKKQYDNANLGALKKKIETTTALSNQALENTIKPIEQQKAALPQQYQSYFDTNEIQHLVNKRQLEERMANLGLTDSGLNRTQETALAVQKSNTTAAYNQKKQAAIASLDNQIAQLRAQSGLNLQSTLLGIQDQYDTAKENYAADMVKAEQMAAAQAEAARIKAANTQNNNKRKDFVTRLGYMADSDLENYSKMGYIYDYINYYDEDINSNTFLNNDVKTLLSAANISENDWQTYMRNRLGIVSVPQQRSNEYTSWLKASKPSLK